MGAFDDVELEWAGKAYTIPANKVMGAIARIEDVMTLGELLAYVERETAPFGKIAAAYGAVLRYAGCKVSDEDVYRGIFAAARPADTQSIVITSLTTLLAMMMPKQAAAEKESPQGNRKARRAAAGSVSSKKLTRQP
jgi:hypothetical protein